MQVKQVANALDLVEYFARTGRPATLTELAQAFDWPRSSTFNLIATLLERGYLYEPKPRGGYYPTPRWSELATDLGAAEPLPDLIHPTLKALSKATGETVFIAGPAGSHAVMLDVVESNADIRYAAAVGKRLPMHATATGRALLSQYAERERAQLLRRARYERYQPSSPMSPDAVEAEIRLSQARGWYGSKTEFTSDVTGLAVPLPLAGRRLAIALGGPTFRVAGAIEQHAAAVMQAVQGLLADAGEVRGIEARSRRD